MLHYVNIILYRIAIGNYKKHSKMKKETVLIVGGSGFLGSALIPELEKNGYDVIVGDKNPPKAQEGAVFIQLDATNPDSISTFRENIEKNNIQISHVVSLVGGCVETGLTNIFQTSAAEIDETVDLNLKSQLYIVRFLGEHLMATKRANKSFTLLSSINTHAGYSIPFYSAAKGGLHPFIRPVAIELGLGGVRINIVTAGTIRTPSTENQPKNFEERAKSAALKRLITPNEVIHTIINSSIKSTGTTGQEFVVDAGQSINPAQSLYEQERTGLIPE